jgi:small subunit ribosomal protein S16
MSVRIRLTRVGSKKNPIWRVVVADQRSPRDGRSIETIGQYNAQTDPSTIVLDKPRLEHWLERGAVPTNTVKSLIRAHAKAPAVAEEPAPAAAEGRAEVAEEPAAPAEDAAAAPEQAAAEAEQPAAAAEEPAAEAPPAEESAG